MVRAAGAKEVHVRISCPPTISPCFYGVDTPRKSELIAATHTHRGDPRVSRGRQRRLSEPRRAVERGRHASAAPTAPRATPATIRSPFPSDEATLSAARADARYEGRTGGEMRSTPRTRATEDTDTSGADRAPCAVLCVLCVLCVVRAAVAAQEPRGAAGRLGGAAPGRDRQARGPRLRHPDQRVAHGAAHGRARRRCPRCFRRSPSRPTATSATARSCCSPASTIRGRRTRCASRWPARTIGCAPPRTAFSSTTPIRAMVPQFLAALDKEQGEFVRPALVRALAAHGDDAAGAPGAAARGRARRGLLPERRHRGARRPQGAIRLRRARRRRQARRAAPGRCGDGAGQDRRQARAGDAGRASSARRRGRRSRRSRPPSACSASIAGRTRAISSRR